MEKFPKFKFDEEGVLKSKASGRLVNQNIIFSKISTEFHNCLKKQARNDNIRKLTDPKLVEEVCTKEKLTLDNYLRQERPEISNEKVKFLILSEYGLYFD